MKKMILGAGAFLLSSTAFAGIVHANSVNDPLTTAPTVYGNSTAWAMSPALQSAVVQAGMNHADPSATDWMSDGVASKSAATEKAVNSLYGEFEGAMSYEEAAAYTGDKNAQLTAAQMAEKQGWLAQSGSAMSGKNTSLTAEQMTEKQTWLASNADAGTGMAMDAGKGVGEMSGQGGPLEAAQGSSGADLPACRPGPGDDRCIQLYERGVSRAYAQWSAGRARLGMGGPEEPVTGKDEMASMTSDMSTPAPKVESGAGPTTEPSGARAEGKSAMSMAEGSADMAAADANMESDGMTAEQMQANSAWGSKANAG